MKKSFRLLFFLAIASFLLLSACSSRSVKHNDGETTPEPAELSSSTGSDATMAPVLEEPTSPYPSPETGYGQTYPAPDTGFGYAYPAPEQPGDPYPPASTETSNNPYPEPSDGDSPADDAYPGPGSENTSDAYPPPGQDESSGAYPPPSTQTLAVPTPTPEPQTPTPTPFPTAIPVSARMQATDPHTVELASGKHQLIEFFAFWCGYCKSMAPIIHEFESIYGEEINFIYLDIDDPATKDLKKQLGYQVQPHFLLLDEEGNIIHQWVGLVKAEEFEEVFQAVLQ